MRSKIALVLVIALIGVGIIGFADSKGGQGNQGNQGDNNDQGCSKKKPFCPDDGNPCTDNICDLANGECVYVDSQNGNACW
jgi:hypothetical protein